MHMHACMHTHVNPVSKYKDAKEATWKKGCCRTSAAEGLMQGSQEQSD